MVQEAFQIAGRVPNGRDRQAMTDDGGEIPNNASDAATTPVSKRLNTSQQINSHVEHVARRQNVTVDLLDWRCCIWSSPVIEPDTYQS